jgi:hypothetical protein
MTKTQRIRVCMEDEGMSREEATAWVDANMDDRCVEGCNHGDCDAAQEQERRAAWLEDDDAYDRKHDR